MHTPTIELDELPVHDTLLHPRTGEPLRAVGIVNGRTVWPIMGGDGTEGDANDGGDSGDDSSDDDDTGSDTGAGDDQDDNNDDDTDDGDDDDKRVRKANREAQRYRTELRETQQELQNQGQVLDALRKALLGDDDGDGDEPDPAQLQASVSELQSENRSLQAQLAVHNVAREHNADASALLDSRRFMAELDKLDPSAASYQDAVGRAVKDAVDKDPKLRADQGSSRGGADLPTGSGEGRTKKRGDLQGAIAGRYGG